MSEIEFHAVAKTDDLGEEEVMAVFVGSEEIALYNVEGEYFATHGVCTHENVGLADGFVEGDLIECPLHNACFEIKTGKAVNPPAEISCSGGADATGRAGPGGIAPRRSCQ